VSRWDDESVSPMASTDRYMQLRIDEFAGRAEWYEAFAEQLEDAGGCPGWVRSTAAAFRERESAMRAARARWSGGGGRG